MYDLLAGIGTRLVPGLSLIIGIRAGAYTYRGMSQSMGCLDSLSRDTTMIRLFGMGKISGLKVILGNMK